MAFFFLILFVFKFKLIKSELCYAVDGSEKYTFRDIGVSTNCPNTPNSGCVYISDTQTVSETYYASSGYYTSPFTDISFSIDYLLDYEYGTNDYTYIYYDCWLEYFGLPQSAGLRIGKAYGNANKDQAYLNQGFTLSSECDNLPYIKFTISQVRSGNNTIRFNFQNMCVMGMSFQKYDIFNILCYILFNILHVIY